MNSSLIYLLWKLNFSYWIFSRNIHLLFVLLSEGTASRVVCLPSPSRLRPQEGMPICQSAGPPGSLTPKGRFRNRKGWDHSFPKRYLNHPGRVSARRCNGREKQGKGNRKYVHWAKEMGTPGKDLWWHWLVLAPALCGVKGLSWQSPQTVFLMNLGFLQTSPASGCKLSKLITQVPENTLHLYLPHTENPTHYTPSPSRESGLSSLSCTG